MHRKSLQIAAVWMFGSFVATLAMFAPARLNADDRKLLPAMIPNGKLVQDGVELSIVGPGRSNDQGVLALHHDSSVPLTLTATNKRDEPAEIVAIISVLSRAPVSRLSRTVATYGESWKQEQRITLAPNETKMLTLSPDVKTDPGVGLLVSIRSGESIIVPLAMSVDGYVDPADRAPKR